MSCCAVLCCVPTHLIRPALLSAGCWRFAASLHIASHRSSRHLPRNSPDDGARHSIGEGRSVVARTEHLQCGTGTRDADTSPVCPPARCCLRSAFCGMPSLSRLTTAPPCFPSQRHCRATCPSRRIFSLHCAIAVANGPGSRLPLPVPCLLMRSPAEPHD